MAMERSAGADNFVAGTQSNSETPAMRGLGVGTYLGRGPNWNLDTVLPLLMEMGITEVRAGPEWAGVEKTKRQFVKTPDVQQWFDDVTESGIPVQICSPASRNCFRARAQAEGFGQSMITSPFVIMSLSISNVGWS
jgi:hypothetical protein